MARADTRPAVCIARDPGDTSPARMVASPARFDCRTPQTRWGPGDYWALTGRVPSQLAERPALVRSFNLWQDGVSVWALYADGRLLPLRPARSVASVGTAREHAIPARDAPVIRLLWRVRGAQNLRGIVTGVRLVGATEHARNSVALGTQAGIMAGLCIAFMFFALALWVALRRTFLLAYCAMVGGLLLNLLADAGMLRRLLPALTPLLELRLSGFTFTLCVVGGLWFSRAFLGRGALGARGDRAARAVVLAVLATSLAKEALAPWAAGLLDRVQGTALLAALAMLGYMAACAWTRSHAMRWVWPFTALVPALLIAIRAANIFQLFARPFAVGAAVMAVMASGMFLSALAIAYRVYRLSRERDEARERELVARLLADTDPLTGLLNRRAFLHRAIGRPGEQTLLLTDLDHFKSVNETIGHDGGDEVLRVFARALEAVAPPGALVARIGGEEFAVVASVASGMSPADILHSLRAVRMPFDLAVTTSIGTCNGLLEREADWKLLYRRADRALYDAKAAGRDRVRQAEPVPLAA